MAQFWDSLNFGGKTVPEETPLYTPEFRKASSNIELLRAVARAGREETNRLEEAEGGKPKVVLGQPEPIPSDVIEASLESTARDELSSLETRTVEDDHDVEDAVAESKMTADIWKAATDSESSRTAIQRRSLP
jgi:hypothetical protein